VLSKMFNLAEQWGLRADGSNPCRHVEKFAERKRERILSAAELARLGDALAAYDGSPYVTAAVKLPVFTGARRGEVLGLKWEWVDFERGEARARRCRQRLGDGAAAALRRITTRKAELDVCGCSITFPPVIRSFRNRAFKRYFEAGDPSGLGVPNVARVGRMLRALDAATRSEQLNLPGFYGRPRAEIAQLLGVSRQALHAILAERASVTPEMALRLGKLCGNGPELWLALQTQYDLERLRREKAAEIEAIPTLQAA
jgi:addiction module HigA family antidote